MTTTVWLIEKATPSPASVTAVLLQRGLLFLNDLTSEQLSENAMLALLKRMGFAYITVHGFRSTLMAWASETTHSPDDLSEAELAHQILEKAKAAYKCGKMLEKRRAMMTVWECCCY